MRYIKNFDVNLSYSDDDFMIGQMGHSKYSDKY